MKSQIDVLCLQQAFVMVARRVTELLSKEALGLHLS